MAEIKIYTVKLTNEDLGLIVRALDSWKRLSSLQSESENAAILQRDLMDETDTVDIEQIIQIQDREAGLC